MGPGNWGITGRQRRGETMLTQLSIRNYTTIESLDLELRSGMTVITGETGAGKSIMLDALGLCLGDRADAKTIRSGCDRAEITATFDVHSLPAVRHWLLEHELAAGHEAMLRRVLTSEGRSRAFINGSPVTLQDCSSLGELLVDIHSQHEHQSLLRRAVQRELLDGFAGATELARRVAETAGNWQRANERLQDLREQSDEQTARQQLLAYQVGELEQLALGERELEELEAAQKRLLNASDVLATAQQAGELCDQHEDGARQALKLLSSDAHTGHGIDNIREMLDSAAIQLSEARAELERYVDGIEIDPERLREVEQRLEAIYDIARKHRVMPESLAQHQSALQEELEQLSGSEADIEQLERDCEGLLETYIEQAARLSGMRKTAAGKLRSAVEKRLGALAMGQCQFEVALITRDTLDPHPLGAEQVELRVATNPGTAPQPLGKIASGGELSRISLAIQVVTAEVHTVPSMVFDEVDVGVGGAVAEVVGRLLSDLSNRSQVLCVTHLPQVAAQGEHHLVVSKSDDEKALSSVQHLRDDEDRVGEIARMLGGVKVTEQTRAHAREMLNSAG
jgi:DNA repair protein RecN (Recombination protein N)